MPQLPLTLTRPRTVPYGSELTKHTQKVLKAVWGRAPIQYGSELTKQPVRMTWIRFWLFVIFACLFVYFLYTNDIEALSDYLDRNNTLSCVEWERSPTNTAFSANEFEKLMAGIGAIIPQSRVPPDLLFTAGYTTNVRANTKGTRHRTES